MSPRAEACLDFILCSLREGEERRHLQWFAERHLEQRGNGTLQDLLRWLCVCSPAAANPVGAAAAPALLPPWRLAGWLLQREIWHPAAADAEAEAAMRRTSWALLLELLSCGAAEAPPVEPALTLLVRAAQPPPPLQALPPPQQRFVGSLLGALLEAPQALCARSADCACASVAAALTAYRARARAGEVCCPSRVCPVAPRARTSPPSPHPLVITPPAPCSRRSFARSSRSCASTALILATPASPRS